MKTKLLLLAAIFIASVSISKAEEYREMVKNKVQKEVKYPKKAINEGIEGEVLVSFTVDKNGMLKVLETNASDMFLNEYIVDKLESIKVSTINALPNQVFDMKFTFILL